MQSAVGTRRVWVCKKCPKQLVMKGYEVGFALSGPRWMAPPPPASWGKPKPLVTLAMLTALAAAQQGGAR